MEDSTGKARKDNFASSFQRLLQSVNEFIFQKSMLVSFLQSVVLISTQVITQSIFYFL